MARVLNTFEINKFIKPLEMVIFFVKFFIFLLRTFTYSDIMISNKNKGEKNKWELGQ